MSLLRLSSSLLLVSLISGCDYASHFWAQKNAAYNVELPASLIIERAVMALVPSVAGQRNDLMMRQVCALARGERSQEQVNQTLRRQGVELNNVPPNGHPLSLLVNPDLPQRQTACAAYIATSVMVLPKNSEFMVESKNRSSTPTSTKLVVDPQKLDSYLRVQLSAANTDADFFTLIATKLETTQGLTQEEYGQRSQRLFAALAPAYLKRIREVYSDNQDTSFTLLNYSEKYFSFRSSNGYLFKLDHNELSISLFQAPWFGRGRLLGKQYSLSTVYFAPELIKAIDAEP